MGVILELWERYMEDFGECLKGSRFCLKWGQNFVCIAVKIYFFYSPLTHQLKFTRIDYRETTILE